MGEDMNLLYVCRAKKLYAAGENLEETAEKELAAASSIDQATQVKKKRKQKKKE